MYNLIQIIGRIVDQKSQIDKKETIITIGVPRNYKNNEGVYETDFIPVKLVGQLADTTTEYCEKGDLIGIRGRIEKLSKEDYLEIVAEKVTFLSSKPKGENE